MATGICPDISFIVLSWNAAVFLERCFDAVLTRCAAEGIGCEIHVVDNGSADASPALIAAYAARYPGVFFPLLLKKNLGTTVTRNRALALARGRFIVFLDADAQILSGSIRSVLDILARRPDIGLVAPRLVRADGSLQPSVKRFPSMTAKLAKVPALFFPFLAQVNRDFYPAGRLERPFFADTAISACWFFRRELVDSVGLLDEAIFYSPEDLDYSVRIWKAGKKILYWPALRLCHFTQQISHRNPFSKVSVSHLGGLFHYYRRHGGWISTSHLRGMKHRVSAMEDPTCPAS